MKSLLFFSRVTFLYNLCMLVTFMLRYANFITDGTLKSTIVVAGYLLAVTCNSIIVLWCLLWMIKGKRPGDFHPRWLFAINCLFFIFQIYLVLR